MDITVRKKEDRERDPLVSAVVSGKDFVSRYGNALFTAVLVAVIAAGGAFFYSSMRNRRLQSARHDFGRAMMAYANNDTAAALNALKVAADNYRNLPQGAYSAYMAGHILAGKEAWEEAVDWYRTAAEMGKGTGFVAVQAREGLAACHEALGEYEQALEHLRTALRAENGRYRHSAIHWKMALIYNRLGRSDMVHQSCRAILSDTLAVEYRQKAENLLVESQAGK